MSLEIVLKSNLFIPPVGFPPGGAILFIESYIVLNLSSLVSKSGGGSFPIIPPKSNPSIPPVGSPRLFSSDLGNAFLSAPIAVLAPSP